MAHSKGSSGSTIGTGTSQRLRMGTMQRREFAIDLYGWESMVMGVSHILSALWFEVQYPPRVFTLRHGHRIRLLGIADLPN